MLTIDRLVKSHSPQARAVDGLTLTLQRGVTGLVGHNGAGKTTLIEMLCTLTRPTAGSILLDGVDVVAHPDAMRRRLGYLPQHFAANSPLTAHDLLTYLATLKGVRSHARVAECLEMVHLQDCARRRVDALSGGMLRRLGLAQALLSDPDVLVLDEPTTGLDLDERARFRELMTMLGRRALVLISTHIVPDIEHVADELVLMRRGRLLAHTTPRQALAAGGARKLEDALVGFLREDACAA